MAVQRDKDAMRNYVIYQGQYHNHKEQLGYLVAAGYITGSIWLFLHSQPGNYSSWTRLLLVVVGVLSFFYVCWQFHLRSIAATRIEWFINQLGRENWPEDKQRGWFTRWAAPGAAIIVMSLVSLAALVRVMWNCGP